MTSKIINMVEKFKDAEDLFLESILESEPIADEGFSKRVVKHIRRRLWLRRLTLPVAMVVGAGIAVKPASELVVAVSRLLAVIPGELVDTSVAVIPQLQYVVIGAMLLVACFLGMRILED